MRALTMDEVGFVSGGRAAVPEPGTVKPEGDPPVEVIIVFAERTRDTTRNGNYIDPQGMIWADRRAYDEERSRHNIDKIITNYAEGVTLGGVGGALLGVPTGPGAGVTGMIGTVFGALVIGPANVLRGGFTGDYWAGRRPDQS